MVKKNILICVDRDGTLIYDDRFYLGRTNDWKSKIKLLKNTISGLKLIKKELPDAKIYMVTNQPGIAIKDFPLLTIARDKEVNDYVMNLLKKKGANLDGYEFCPYANKAYVEKHPQYKFRKKFVKESDFIKPGPGMVYSALKKEKLKLSNTQVYTIGDRFLDVKLGLNVRGVGIQVLFKKTITELDKTKEYVKEHGSKGIYITQDFLDAAKLIIKMAKRS